MMATVRLVREDAAPDTAEMKALVRTTHAFFEEYCNASMRVSQETLRSVMDVDKPDQLADIIAANVLTRSTTKRARRPRRSWSALAAWPPAPRRSA